MTSATCGQCDREPAHGDAFLAMQPGLDGRVWWLCRRCWSPAPKAIRTARAVAGKRPAAQPAPRGGLL